MFAESVDVVIGVDTHRDSHALALVDAGLGALIVEERIEANREGYRRRSRWRAVAASVGSGRSRAPVPTEPVSLVIYSSGASGCSNSSGCSSGKTIRHRLDRGGDRQLNRALHTIVLARRRGDQRTIAYVQRRISEGKTEREAIRSLKRYNARSLYRLMEHTNRDA